MNAIVDTMFEKFLPGWKTRISAVLVALIGLYPCGGVVPEGVDPGLAGGLLCQVLGVTLPGWVYTTMYALTLLGVGEKVNQLVKSNATMAEIEVEKSGTGAGGG